MVISFHIGRAEREIVGDTDRAKNAIGLALTTSQILLGRLGTMGSGQYAFQ